MVHLSLLELSRESHLCFIDRYIKGPNSFPRLETHPAAHWFSPPAFPSGAPGSHHHPIPQSEPPPIFLISLNRATGHSANWSPRYRSWPSTSQSPGPVFYLITVPESCTWPHPSTTTAVQASIITPLENWHGLFLPIRGPPKMKTRAVCLRGFPFAHRIDRTLGVTLLSSQPHRQQDPPFLSPPSPASPLPGLGAPLPTEAFLLLLCGETNSLPCSQDIQNEFFPVELLRFCWFLCTPKSPWRLRLHLFQVREVSLKVWKQKRNASLLNHKVDEILAFSFKMRTYSYSHFTNEYTWVLILKHLGFEKHPVGILKHNWDISTDSAHIGY